MWPKVWLHDWHICVLVSNSMWCICNENGCDLLCNCAEAGKRLLFIYGEIYSGAGPFHYEFGNIAHFSHHLNFHSLFFCLHTNAFCHTWVLKGHISIFCKQLKTKNNSGGRVNQKSCDWWKKWYWYLKQKKMLWMHKKW